MRNHKMILAFVLSLNCVLAMPAEDMASNNDATNDTLSEGTKMLFVVRIVQKYDFQNGPMRKKLSMLFEKMI